MTISLEPGAVQAFHHLDKADTFAVDHTAAEVDAGRYDALVLPGGVANPDRLRVDADAVAFVRVFFDQAKPVAVICHGPWTLIDAGVVTGRTLTSWPSLRTERDGRGHACPPPSPRWSPKRRRTRSRAIGQLSRLERV